MTHHATSADGTQIAYDRIGDGPVVILIGGLLCDRGKTKGLADALAERGFKVVNFDRRGRGQSGDTPPYAVAREVEDVAALLNACGGQAALYGHSSGAGLALQCAAAGLELKTLVLHEPPYSQADADSLRTAQDLAVRVCEALNEGRLQDAVRHFFGSYGMPAAMLDEMCGDANVLRMAHTMAYDMEVMGEIADGGAIPFHLLPQISAPSVILAGSGSLDFFQDTGRRLADAMPNAVFELFDGDHESPGDIVAAVVARHLGR